MRFKNDIYAYLLLLVLLASGCRKDFDFDKVKAPTWKPDLAIPLVDDSITFLSGLQAGGGEKYFYIDESGDISILFYYNDDAFKISSSDLIILPSYPFSFNHIFTQEEEQIISVQDFTMPPQTFTFNLAQTLPGVRIDKLLIKKGAIIAASNNSFNNPGSITLSFPQGTKNGQPFSATLSPIAEGPRATTIDLSGVLFDFTDNPGMLEIQLSGTMKQSSRPQAGDNLIMNFSMELDTIGRFEGYLGQNTFPMGEEYVKINVFNNAYALGTLWFEDPSVNITVVNSVGISARVTMDEVRAVNTASNVSYDIADNLGANKSFFIPSPSVNATQPVTTTVEYNNANTNNSLDPFINLKPDRVYFKISTETNPDNSGFNFFTDTSSFYAKLEVRFPLYGYFDNLTIQDTFEFNLYEQNNIDYVKLRTAITNGLPLMARMQVYFTDEHYNKLDSLTGTDNILVKEAPVDPSTHLPYPGQYGVKDTIFILDNERIQKLENARKMLVKAVMNTSGGGNQLVKIRAQQMLKLDFSALIKLSEDLNSNK